VTMQRHSKKIVGTMSHDIEWLTIKEASKITGRSVNALNLLVNRQRVDKIKKIDGKWHIHRDSLITLCQPRESDIAETRLDIQSIMSEAVSPDIAIPMIPLEHYEKKREVWDIERDKLHAGLMMYRYKFEEAERQLKLLPAPAEIVTTKMQEQDAALQEKEIALARAQEILQKAREDYDTYKTSIVDLKQKLQEEENAKTDLLQQLQLERRPWWKKILGLH
jgi:hypothetical protein